MTYVWIMAFLFSWSLSILCQFNRDLYKRFLNYWIDRAITSLLMLTSFLMIVASLLPKH